MDLLARRNVWEILSGYTSINSLFVEFCSLFELEPPKGSWNVMMDRELRNLVTSGLSPADLAWK